MKLYKATAYVVFPKSEGISRFLFTLNAVAEHSRVYKRRFAWYLGKAEEIR